MKKVHTLRGIKENFRKGNHISIFKLTLAVNGICMLVIASMMLHRLIDISYFITETETSRLETLNRLAATSLGDYLGKIKLSLNTADYWISSNPDVDPRWDKNFEDLVNILENNMGGKVDLRLVTKTGDLYYSPANGREPLANVSDREYFTAQQNTQRKEIFIAEPVKSRVTGKWGIPISYPVSNAHSEVSIIFASLEPPTLDKSFEHFLMHQGGTLMMVRADGIILANAPFDQFEAGKSLVGTEIWKRVILNEKKGKIIYRTTEIDGKDRFISSEKVIGFPIYIVSTCEYNKVMKPLEVTFYNTVIGIGLLVLVAICIGWVVIYLMRRLEVAVNRLVDISTTDHLTGLSNRREFLERYEFEKKRMERYGGNLAIAIMDIDYFKMINDNFGHDTGDRVLVQLADLLEKNIRETDMVARWGGEEFLFLLVNSDVNEAETCIEKLMTVIREHDFGLGERVTCSFGLTCLMKEDTWDTVISRADMLLYQAKNRGRNQVVTDNSRTEV